MPAPLPPPQRLELPRVCLCDGPRGELRGAVQVRREDALGGGGGGAGSSGGAGAWVACSDDPFRARAPAADADAAAAASPPMPPARAFLLLVISSPVGSNLLENPAPPA